MSNIAGLYRRIEREPKQYVELFLYWRRCTRSAQMPTPPSTRAAASVLPVTMSISISSILTGTATATRSTLMTKPMATSCLPATTITPEWAVEVGFTDLGTVRHREGFPINLKGELKTRLGYVNGQYHMPIGDTASLDLSLGRGFSRAEFMARFRDPGFGCIGCVTLKDTTSDSGMIYGVGVTMKLTDSLYLRPALTVYDFEFDDVDSVDGFGASQGDEEFLEPQWRFGVDLIYDF